MVRYISFIILALAAVITFPSCESTDCQALCAPLPSGNFNLQKLNIGVNTFAVNNNDAVALEGDIALLVDDEWKSITGFTWRQFEPNANVSGLKFSLLGNSYTVLQPNFVLLNNAQLGAGTFIFTIKVNSNSGEFTEADLKVEIEAVDTVCECD